MCHPGRATAFFKNSCIASLIIDTSAAPVYQAVSRFHSLTKSLLLCNDLTEFLDNCDEGFILIGPGGHRLCVTRQALQVCKGRMLPVTRAYKKRDNACLSSLMAFQSLSHFVLETSIRCQKISTDEQEDDVGKVDRLINGLGANRSGEDLLIGPLLNQSFAMKQTQMNGKFLSPLAISECIGIENPETCLFLLLFHSLS